MIKESIYKIDYDKLVRWLTPLTLRFTEMRLWIEALVHEVKVNYYSFIAYRDNVRLRLSITSSRCRLEYMLNYLFYKDGLTTAYNYRIILDEGGRERGEHLFLGDGGADPTGGVEQPVEEGKAIYLTDEHWLYTGTEAGELNKTDYMVQIPRAIYDSISLNALKSWLKQYQLAGKKFIITIY